jgi:dTDP-4-dehydrorhamnose 3,5-epimerase
VQFLETAVDGVWIVDIEPISDERGFFARAFSRDEFAERGMSSDFVQENIGFNPRSGTLRGLHLQHEPHAEAKLVRCTRGAAWDVAADVRSGSSTYGGWFGVELSADNRRMLYVPEGCAHGYLTLTEDTEIRYLTTHEYVPASASGVPFDDPALGVDWPAPIELVSENDRSWPPLTGEPGR